MERTAMEPVAKPRLCHSVPEPNPTSRLLTNLVLWPGLLLIGLLALPTAVLLGLIGAVWSVTNWLLTRIKYQSSRKA